MKSSFYVIMRNYSFIDSRPSRFSERDPLWTRDERRLLNGIQFSPTPFRGSSAMYGEQETSRRLHRRGKRSGMYSGHVRAEGKKATPDSPISTRLSLSLSAELVEMKSNCRIRNGKLRVVIKCELITRKSSKWHAKG